MPKRKKPALADAIMADYGAIEVRALAHMAQGRSDWLILDDMTPDTPEAREAARKRFTEFVNNYGNRPTKENDR